MQSLTIAALKKAYPAWQVTVWVVPRGTKVLADNDSNVDEVFEAPIRNSLGGHLRTIGQLRQPRFDLGIVLSPGQRLKSAVYLYLAGIPRRIGHAYPHGTWLTDAPVEDPTLHDIEQNLRLLEPLGVRREKAGMGHYKVRIPSSAQVNAEDLLGHFNVRQWRFIVGLHAGSAPGFVWKRWPVRHFAAVAIQLIRQHRAHVLIFGGLEDELVMRELHNRVGPGASLVFTDLMTVAALMQYCAMFLSNDSGLMHLAAATGVPTYGLFGPTDERHTGPRGAKSQVIRAPGTKPVYNTEKNFDLGEAPHPTILAITPQLVLDTIVRGLPQ